jgi:hypothetical protein
MKQNLYRPPDTSQAHQPLEACQKELTKQMTQEGAIQNFPSKSGIDKQPTAHSGVII